MFANNRMLYVFAVSTADTLSQPANTHDLLTSAAESLHPAPHRGSRHLRLREVAAAADVMLRAGGYTHTVETR